MALVIVASNLPMAVLCTNIPVPPDTEISYSVAIVGQRDPAAINNVGFTYDVEDGPFGEWIAANHDLAPHVRIVTQADIDAWADTTDAYGYELGLEAAEGGDDASGTIVGMVNASDRQSADQRLALALERHRFAEMQLRQSEMARHDAEVLFEEAKIERDEAEKEALAASALVEEEAANRPPPPVRPEPEPRAEA